MKVYGCPRCRGWLKVIGIDAEHVHLMCPDCLKTVEIPMDEYQREV